MQKTPPDLGRLISAHPVAPIYVQRAVLIAVLSFLFFLGMMLAYYLRQSLGYFLLATAFLVTYLITMFSWFTQRKAVVRIYENGLEYRSHQLEWSDIDSVSDAPSVTVTPKDCKPFELPSTIADSEALVRHIRFRIATSAANE